MRVWWPSLSSNPFDIVQYLSPRRALGVEPAYPRSLQKHSGYTLEQLQPAAAALASLHAKAPNSSLPAVYKKYSQPKFSEVAKLVAGPIAL